jgi:hypothetical protein
VFAHRLITGLLASLVLLGAPGVARPDGPGEQADPTPAAPKPPKGSIARQLLLRYKLQAMQEGQSLAAAIDHSRQAWESLQPDQRDRFRQVARAILEQSPEDQQKLLEHYEKLIRMSHARRQAYRRRAEWLKAVMDHLTDEQKKELLRMTATDRAKRLMEYRDELQQTGTIDLGDDSEAGPGTPPGDEETDESASPDADPNRPGSDSPFKLDLDLGR